MSDITQTQITVSGQTVIIYNNRKPDAYAEADIFDPNNPTSGKYFPSLYSLVMKTDGSAWYVATRDESTFKVTLKPISIVTTDTESTDTVKIVSYGNDYYCLYQDTRVSPYKLVADAKILFYGNNLKEYDLVHTNANGEDEIISMYLDSNDQFTSNRIPMSPISDKYQAYRFPTNCHTTVNLTEGEPITMRVFNNLGNLAATLTIFVRDAIWLNDLRSHTNPIVKLDAECLQVRGDDFYIKERQDPANLNIKPYLLYADGSKVYLNIDNMQCFLYGLEHFVPSYPGYSQTLVIKYFLNYRETAINQSNVNNVQFLTCTKNLVVIKDKEDYSVKISVIPRYDAATETWKLGYFLYTDDRDAVYEITDAVQYQTDNAFNGSQTKWGVEQLCIIDYDLQSVLNTSDPLPGSQVFYITVYTPTKYDRYLIRDNQDTAIVYGADSSLCRRPIIHYDVTRNQYYIPTSIFQNKESVIESFYRKARPFFDTRTETEPPTPTHFTIREAVGGKQIVTSPIDLDNYGAAWNTIVGDEVNAGGVLVVEFLQLVDSTYVILYGVPVDVRAGTYNDEDSDIYK
jgi:hypothetical protein